MKIYVQLCLAELLEWEMFQAKVAEKTKTYLYSTIFFLKIMLFMG